MPYVTTNQVKQVRNTLKKMFPAVKFSVTRRHYSTIHIVIAESPFKWAESYVQLNPFYLEEYDHSAFLKAVAEVAFEGNRIISEDGDYGSIPNFYVDIHIGTWEKPHVQTGKELCVRA